MTEPAEQDRSVCSRTLAALAGGGADVDWQEVERHLAACDACTAGLDRFTAAVDEQFAASRSLDALELPATTDGASVGSGALRRSPEIRQAARATPDSAAAGSGAVGSDSDRIVVFPSRTAASAPSRPASARMVRRVLFGLGAVAAVVLLAIGIVALLPGSRGSRSVSADRRPEFVPSLEVLPARASHIYYGGEQIQVCLRINQPSRVHLSVLKGHATFDLYDADTSPGEHCFPEQVGAIQTRATLRVDVFYGAERVAREDFVLLPR